MKQNKNFFNKIYNYYKFNVKIIIKVTSIILFCLIFLTLTASFATYVKADGEYYTKNDVALYLKTYHELPSNYMTKAERNNGANGEDSIFEGMVVGGDKFENWHHDYERLGVPKGIIMYECDIVVPGVKYTTSNKDYGYGNRGVYRLVYYTYNNETKVYYCEHPEHNNSLTPSEDDIKMIQLQPAGYTFMILTVIYSVGLIGYYLVIYITQKKMTK